MTEKDMNIYEVQAFLGCCKMLLDEVEALINSVMDNMNSDKFNIERCRSLMFLVLEKVIVLGDNWDRAEKTAMGIPTNSLRDPEGWEYEHGSWVCKACGKAPHQEDVWHYEEGEPPFAYCPYCGNQNKRLED